MFHPARILRNRSDAPVRMVNDAAMQALGSYDGGRMLFLDSAPGLVRP